MLKDGGIVDIYFLIEKICGVKPSEHKQIPRCSCSTCNTNVDAVYSLSPGLKQF